MEHNMGMKQEIKKMEVTRDIHKCFLIKSLEEMIKKVENGELVDTASMNKELGMISAHANAYCAKGYTIEFMKVLLEKI